MTRLFISYRREDSAGHAGRLFDRLIDCYGGDRVFMDHHDLIPGHDFSAAIHSHLEQADAVLAIIGPRWAETRDGNGALRLEQPEDFVRRELLSALQLSKRLVPVLVGGAALPAAEQVPHELAALLRLQACELRDARFDADLEALLASLPTPTPPARSVDMTGRWVAIVQYPWQSKPTKERFDFELDGDELMGTATFLGEPRALEDGELLADGARFNLRTDVVRGDETRRMTHRYRIRCSNGRLLVRMQSSGGFDDPAPIKFEANRA
jgi:hypothetical protein